MLFQNIFHIFHYFKKKHLSIFKPTFLNIIISKTIFFTTIISKTNSLKPSILKFFNIVFLLISKFLLMK